jgi:hypothetical protein
MRKNYFRKIFTIFFIFALFGIFLTSLSSGLYILEAEPNTFDLNLYSEEKVVKEFVLYNRNNHTVKGRLQEQNPTCLFCPGTNILSNKNIELAPYSNTTIEVEVHPRPLGGDRQFNLIIDFYDETDAYSTSRYTIVTFNITVKDDNLEYVCLGYIIVVIILLISIVVYLLKYSKRNNNKK